MAKFCYLRLYLGIETVSCRLLQGMVTIVMDWNFKKLGQFLLPSVPVPGAPARPHYLNSWNRLFVPWNKLLLHLFEGQQFSL